MRPLRLIAALPALCLTSSALASGAEDSGLSEARLAKTCLLAYEAFEALIPHLNLAECPKTVLPGKNVFCRAAIGADSVKVYAFDEEGDQCLRAVRAFGETELELRFP